MTGCPDGRKAWCPLVKGRGFAAGVVALLELGWRMGKRIAFEVDPVALHMHERVSTQAIVRMLGREHIQRDLFAGPQHAYANAVQFHQWDIDWANRTISGIRSR